MYTAFKDSKIVIFHTPLDPGNPLSPISPLKPVNPVSPFNPEKNMLQIEILKDTDLMSNKKRTVMHSRIQLGEI